ncbi:MAG TPA: 50S ribosomal protein L2 [Candidatus Peribacterales bacterium]|nr:50S ribosomal protein L2 [Candidatus Peribacterales bacterium]
MVLKTFKPTTPGRRQMTMIDYSVLTKIKPDKSLTYGKKRISGRNGFGHVTVRRRGGGHKRLARIVDFQQADKQGIPAAIRSIEYDPNRSAWIALAMYNDGERRYVLAPEGMKVGDTIVCAERTKIKTGNRMQLMHIPVGFKIYNVQIEMGKKGTVCRSAGSSATLTSLDGEYAQVQLPSGEVRYVPKTCYASIGIVSNGEHNLVNIGKAGRTRWMGRRPKVLGKSMNAVDHPHGGGEGHSPIGLKGPKTPWGKPAYGVPTRSRKHPSNRWIVRRRPKKLGRRKR